MDGNIPVSNEDREQQFYNARVKEVEDKIATEFKRIFAKRHVNITPAELAFLQARESYLSSADREEYKVELSTNISQEQTPSTSDRPYEDYSRRELEARLQELGVQDTSNKVYRTNGDLITAIRELEAQQA